MSAISALSFGALPNQPVPVAKKKAPASAFRRSRASGKDDSDDNLVTASPRRRCKCDNELALVVDRSRDYADASQVANTRRVYATAGSDFTSHSAAQGFDTLPATAQAVALYATGLAERAKIGTIRIDLAAIVQKHRETGLESPVSHEIVRRYDLKALRDRAVILLGFSAALRRSELAEPART